MASSHRKTLVSVPVCLFRLARQYFLGSLGIGGVNHKLNASGQGEVGPLTTAVVVTGYAGDAKGFQSGLRNLSLEFTGKGANGNEVGLDRMRISRHAAFVSFRDRF
jgi:hypothetical protein